MRCRDVYLQIEVLAGYNPVAPDEAEHGRYRRDCMRMHGHENARIPDAEVLRRRLDALVYREYHDGTYTTPMTHKLVEADVNEPSWARRVPGTVLYAEPGERLFVHVRNADTEPHSFHVHGLLYGIDSDGSWPFGVRNAAGQRSDAICPGEEWTYVFDVTEQTIGVWPFHDHVMDIEAVVDRGLFGAVIVRDPEWDDCDLEVPFFLHRLVGDSTDPRFDSGTMAPGDTFSATFADEGTFEYVCRLHPMVGRVRVVAAGPATASVTIVDSPTPGFAPTEVTIGAGGTVTWTHGGGMPHTVTDAENSPLDSMCINGRAFAGNTPTIVAESGTRIRWYVCNLDLGERWHNFHVHGQRFRFGHETVDTRSIGPAESFVAETVVPQVLLMPRGCEDPGCGHHGHQHGHGHGHDHDALDGDDVLHGGKPKKEKKHRPRQVCLTGDFIVHCHVEMHMMMGMVALVRAVQTVTLDHDVLDSVDFELPVACEHVCKLAHRDGHGQGHGHDDGHDHGEHEHDDGRDEQHGGGHGHDDRPPVLTPRKPGHGHGGHGGVDDCHDCPDVPAHPCHHVGEGHWERLPDLDLFVVHAAVLHTGRVLLWSGTAEVGDPLQSRVWDPATDARTNQAYAEDLFCSGHAFLPDGRLVVAGGAPAGSMRSTHIFDPAAETWTKVSDMLQPRWYPTVLTLEDGRILAASGYGASGVEVYDAAADSWTLVSGADRYFPELYPSLHLLPSGRIFYSRAGWEAASTTDTQSAYLTLTGPASGMWTAQGQQQFHDRQEGAAVVRIDDTVTPPVAEVVVFGGGVSGTATAKNPQTAERIDVTNVGTATWATPALTMAFARTNVSAVFLPDGTVFVVGGQRAGKWAADPQPVLEAEIFDPVTGTFTTTPPMAFPRQYHSVAALLPDGRVLCAGGIDPAHPVERDQRSMEVFSPGYVGAARPVVTAAPASGGYGAVVTITTPDASRIGSVSLIRPNSITHHTDAGHRYVKLPIVATAAGSVDVRLPSSASVAPPGYYMLFVVDTSGVPSVAHFIRVA